MDAESTLNSADGGPAITGTGANTRSNLRVQPSILYLLSAFLMLAGCLLIALPILYRPRGIAQLLVLLSLIQAYEALVVLACGYLLRRWPGSSEGALLLAVEVFFLADVTCTLNACQPVAPKWGLLVAFLGLILALVKVHVLESRAGLPLLRGLKGLLWPVLIFVHLAQALLMPLAALDAPWPALSGGLLWNACGLLAFGLGPAWRRTGAFAPEPGTAGDWSAPRFRRTLAEALVLLAIWQALGLSFIHNLGFNFAWLAPLAFAALLAYPDLDRDRDRSFYLSIWIMALGVWLAFPLLAGTQEAWHFAGDQALSVWRLNAWSAALALALAAKRTRDGALRDAAWGVLWIGLVAHDGPSFARFLREPDALRLDLTLVAISGALAARWSLPRAALLGYAYLALLARGAAHAWHVDALYEFLRYAPLLALLFLALNPSSGRAARAGCATIAILLGWAASSSWAPADLVYFYAVAVALSSQAFYAPRVTLSVLALYVLVANAVRFHADLPAFDLQAGWLAVALAFATFAAAFGLSKQRLPRPEAAGAP